MPTSTAAGTELNDLPLVSELPVEHLVDFSVDLEPAQMVATPLGLRYTLIVRRGRFEGPRLKGEILPGGGDWITFGSDGIGRLDVRATMKTEDGALIHLESGGVSRVPDDAQQRLEAGERIPFEESYIRSTPTFETSDERYSWLNEAVAVGYNEFAPGHIDYRIYKVL
jgi:Protein of unknown function (DUF3237)